MAVESEMMRQTTTASAVKQRSWSRRPEQRDASLSAGAAGDQHVPTRSGKASHEPRERPAREREPSPTSTKRLSVRAQNVLKELAVEVIGEQPPKGDWSPSCELLLALTADRLATTRNCGPHTLREIVDWAEGHGVTIKRGIPAGGSLSQMWSELIANACAGALTSAEVVGALQRSIRRKSVRIPIAFQIVLVKILLSSIE
ncbi:hypothetical protein ACRQ5Q_29270 [Bradyrhizobium sp. PMVTL-01]|uniref:hypothetical protein n=1 Tax=Bradyrhizobium sp. PMVTL-01 TaxID=3434999 RepID=UPI003F7243FF